MPPPKTKPVKGNAAKKEQIAEKVKEIQQRQKNWMRQRDEHLKADTEPPNNKGAAASEEHYSLTEASNGSRRQSVEHTPQGADILKVHHNSPQQLVSQVSDKLNVKVKHGFGAWLQSRQHPDDPENLTHSNTHDHREECSSGTHHVNNCTGDMSASLASNSVPSVQSSNRSYPLSPAEFDSLADSIAAKVKKDLGIRHRNGASLQEGGTETVQGTVQRGRTFVQGLSGEQSAHSSDGSNGVSNGDDVEVDVSSHRCPFCSSLMATPAHVPMLLVPCGHTVCKRCSTSHTNCRLCGMNVGSLTTNIMLQQIIQEFHRKGHKGNRETASLPSTAIAHAHAHAPATWDREGSLPAIPAKATVSYSSQLRSLQERQSTLEEEARSCKREREHIATKVKRAEKQVKAIEREEESLEQQIQQLQEQLQGLRQHKEEYAGEYRHLQEELNAASNQVTLVEQTLKSLGDEIDKVQFLAEGQEDGFHQRHSRYR